MTRLRNLLESSGTSRALTFLSFAVVMIMGSACHHGLLPKDPSDLSPLLRQEALGSPEARHALDLGTGVPLSFAERHGGSPGEFTVAGLGKDSLSFDAQGFTLLGDGSGPSASGIRAEIVRNGLGAPPSGVEPSRSSETRLVGSSSKDWDGPARTFSGLRYAVSDGINLLYSLNSRVLRSSYTVAAGSDPKQIRLRFPDLQSAVTDPSTGRIKLTIGASGRARVLTLLPPKATQGASGTLSARYTIESKTVGLELDGYDPAAALQVDLWLAYGDISHDYDARTGAQDVAVVVRRVASLSSPGNNDVLVARIEASGRLLSTTILGGSGDDVPIGLTVSADGKIYVTGKTNSRDFPLVQPLQRENRGGYDAFLLALDPGGQKLLASTYLGGSGDDAGESVAVDPRREIHVAGRGWLDCAAPRTSRTAFATLFPKPLDGDGRADYFLANMPPELDRLLSLDRFSAPRLHGPVAVWLSNLGVPVVGVFSTPPFTCIPGTDQTYKMSHLGDPAFDNDPYVNINTPGNPLSPSQTGWGYHALRWKSIGNPSIVYNPASATNIPTSWVNCGQEFQLNTAEATGSVFASDPGGLWQCYQHSSLESLGLAAVFYMHRFDSPVYTNVKTLNINGNWQSFAFGIEEASFCAVGPPGSTLPKPLHEMCNLDNVDPTTIQPNCVYGGAAYYRLKELKGRTWGSSYLVYYLPSVSYVSDDGAPWYDKWYLPGDYIGDPPADQVPLLPYVDDAVRQLTGRMLTERELEVTIHPIAGMTRTATFSGLVKPLDAD